MKRYLLKHKDDIAAEILFCEEDGSLHQVLSSACENTFQYAPDMDTKRTLPSGGATGLFQSPGAM